MFWGEKVIWGGTLALGLQFFYVGSRVRFDRSYAWFGISLLLSLPVLAWGIPGSRHPLEALAPGSGSLAAQAAALAMMPALILFFFHVTGVFLRAGFAAFLACAAATACFLSAAALRPAPSWLAVDPLRYAFALAPCAFLCLALIGRSLADRIRSTEGRERRRYLALSAGWGGFCLAGAWDGAVAVLSGSGPIMGHAPYGFVLFVAAGVHLLTERFLALHRANRETLARLAGAFADLRESAQLKELGVSAASISHEIRNYAATLKGNALLLRRDLDKSSHREEVERIRATADRMETVSRDIALYSQAGFRLDRKPVALDVLAGECIRRRFPERQGVFRVHVPAQAPVLSGDAARLEQVFLNLFKNALEAGARQVDIRFRTWGNRLVMVVEDDGIGCLPEDLDRLTQPFFSGKGEAGTGLGCAIAESILAAHGASMRSYSKNALGKGGSGLVLNLVFPIASPPAGPSPSAGDILVVSEDAQTRNNMVLPMIHLGLHPVVLSLEVGMREWGSAHAAKTLFLDHALAERHFRREYAYPAVLVDRDRKASFAGRPGSAADAFLFTEESLTGLIPEGAAA